MTVALIILGWLLLGGIGSFLSTYFAFYAEGLPVTVADIVVGVIFAVLGPVMFCVGVVFTVGHMLKRLGLDGARVVFQK